MVCSFLAQTQEFWAPEGIKTKKTVSKDIHSPGFEVGPPVGLHSRRDRGHYRSVAIAAGAKIEITNQQGDGDGDETGF